MSKHGKLIGDGATDELKKAAGILSWLSAEGFVKNLIKWRIERQREKKAKKERQIRELTELYAKHEQAKKAKKEKKMKKLAGMVAQHGKTIRSLTQKIDEKTDDKEMYE